MKKTRGAHHVILVRRASRITAAKIIIGVGLVSLLATVAGAGVMLYMKYGGVETINKDVQSREPSDFGTEI
ncbi:hypothetical protein RRG08_019931 [Elysia crispata]|uniref:Uncharacterized protein n=1 Tax=Elysia crispata TaxID=231223 RepID=A0AAE0ZDN1_9GAST|nr:hypothetical protein RRG08_019931 [Elysia crispata]